MAKQRKKKRYRDAKTGRIVTKEYAEHNPDTTVAETYVVEGSAEVSHEEPRHPGDGTRSKGVTR